MLPFGLQALNYLHLVLRQDTSGDIRRVDAHLRRDSCGRAGVVAGEQVRRQPQVTQLRHSVCGILLHGVAHSNKSCQGTVHLNGHRGRSSALGVLKGACQSVERNGGAADADRATVDKRGRSLAHLILEVLRSRHVAGGLHDGAGDRVLGASLHARGEAQDFALLEAVSCDDVRNSHFARGDRAGLIHDHRVHLAGGFENLRALDQQPQLGAAAGAHQDRGRGGKAERARAGDDQHRHRSRERVGNTVAHQQVPGQRHHRNQHHRRDEDL